MTIYFGAGYDGPLLAAHCSDRFDVIYAGPRKLLRLLESELGRPGQPERNEHLRIEMYRQSALEYLSEAPLPPFFAASFEADRFATATALLAYRDALLNAGWDFQTYDSIPSRLAAFAAIEQRWQHKYRAKENTLNMRGEAERWQAVLKDLSECRLPIEQVVLAEPEVLYQPHIRRLLAQLRHQGCTVIYTAPTPQAADPESQLGRFQRYLCGGQAGSGTATGDENIVLLHARNDTEAAHQIALTLSEYPEWRPAFLIPEARQNLELALQMHGLPAFGQASVTLARPLLQVLKLAPSFLWEPVDVFKLMEFVTLPVKPLDRGLALEIARVMSERPGLYSDQWFGAVYGYLNRPETDRRVQEQYEFWFQRRRYRAEAAAPKWEAAKLFEYLHDWAVALHEHSRESALMVLAQQANRIGDLLDALPEQQLTFLELERIVRTIVEPAPAQLAETEKGHYPYCHHPGAVIEPTDELIWWNCLYENDAPPPDFWTPEERAWLARYQCFPEHPHSAAQRQLHARLTPLLQTRHKLYLALPEYYGGSPAVHSLLPADIAAFLGVMPQGKPSFTALAEPLRPLKTPPPRSSIQVSPQSFPSAGETPTSMESLFYYPHRWYLKHQTGIYPANILSVSRDNTLSGNLAHRFFELLLANNNFADMDREQVHNWVEESASDLLRKEGATLLLYGREPERKAFLQKIKNAAWNLISMLHSNNWTVVEAEMELTGECWGRPMKGKADLVLQRGAERAIIDLKWSGAKYRRELIKNEEDIQLVFYSWLLPPKGEWPHTAYYILESGKMIARNNAAFKEALVAGNPCPDHAEVSERIFLRMERTWKWRMEQLAAGQLEIRTKQTAAELEDLYAEVLSDLLEMKSEDASWDPYRTLIEFMR